MYLLGESGGYRYQERLWQMRSRSRLQLLELMPAEIDGMAELMARYRNIPMDLADASLVAVAKSRHLRRLFTVDSDFYIYRMTDGTVLEVIPWDRP
jgi:predicted nucleic acid-binding protein